MYKTNYDKFRQLEAQFAQYGLRVRSHKQVKRGEDMIAVWDVIGSPANHDRAVEALFADAEVKEFRF